MNRNTKDGLLKLCVYTALFITLTCIVSVIGFSFIRGIGALNYDFIFGDHGIMPAIVSTLYIVLISLSISIPIGIGAAIYLEEYAKDTPVVRLIQLATQSLTGVPSIVFGLFGLAVFVRFFNFNISLLSAGLTLAIMNLPVIIRSVQEALKSVPDSYREASLALGATKIGTIVKVVLPSALPGIMTALILSIGRIIGESAPLLMTAGVSLAMPQSIFEGGRTLTVHLYLLVQEASSPEAFDLAFATATVLVITVLVINVIARYVSHVIMKKKHIK